MGKNLKNWIVFHNYIRFGVKRNNALDDSTKGNGLFLFFDKFKIFKCVSQ